MLLLFLFGFLFCWHCYSPFHSAWNVLQRRSVAIKQCIEGLKNEVKKKIHMKSLFRYTPTGVTKKKIAEEFCFARQSSSFLRSSSASSEKLIACAPTSLVPQDQRRDLARRGSSCPDGDSCAILRAGRRGTRKFRGRPSISHPGNHARRRTQLLARAQRDIRCPSWRETVSAGSHGI